MGDYLFLYQSDMLVNYLPKAKLDNETLEYLRGKVKEEGGREKPSAAARFFRIAIAVFVGIAVVFLLVSYYLQANPR